MRQYELALILDPNLDEQASKAAVERIQGWITDAGGVVDKVDVWGKRPLAYPIRKQREGQYVFLKTRFDGAFCARLERNLRLMEPLMRFLLIREDK